MSKLSPAAVKSVLATLPSALAEHFELNQDEVTTFLTTHFSAKTNSKPPSAYIVFSNRNRDAVKKELTDNGELEGLDGKAAFGKLGKELGRRWQELSAEEKASYSSGAASTSVKEVKAPAAETKKSKTPSKEVTKEAEKPASAPAKKTVKSKK